MVRFWMGDYYFTHVNEGAKTTEFLHAAALISPGAGLIPWMA
jgi:hypothetical protein